MCSSSSAAVEVALSVVLACCRRRQKAGLQNDRAFADTGGYPDNMVSSAVNPVLALLLLLHAAVAVEYLSAPWTPFLENGDVAFERIPAIAQCGALRQPSHCTF